MPQHKLVEASCYDVTLRRLLKFLLHLPYSRLSVPRDGTKGRAELKKTEEQ